MPVCSTKCHRCPGTTWLISHEACCSWLPHVSPGPIRLEDKVTVDTGGLEQSSPVPRTRVPATTLSRDTVATHRAVGLSTEVYVKFSSVPQSHAPLFHCSAAPGDPPVGRGIRTERLLNGAGRTEQEPWRSVGERPGCGWVTSIRGPVHLAGPTPTPTQTRPG